MKNRLLQNVFIWLFVGLFPLSFTACEEDGEAEKVYNISMQVLNSNGFDVTTSGDVEEVALYIFDDQERLIMETFLSKAAIEGKQTIHIDNRNNSSQLTIVAYGNYKDVKLPDIAGNDPISNLKIKLKQSGESFTPPGKLYYGKTVIMPAPANEVQPVEMRPVTGGVVLGFYEKDMEGNTYHAKISNLANTLDYEGNITGEEASFTLPTNKVSEEMVGLLGLVSNEIFLFQSSSIPQVDFYRNGELIEDIFFGSDELPVSIQPDHTIYIIGENREP